MVFSTNLSSISRAIVLCLFLTRWIVAASPTSTSFPEVIPGPGLPSLESLGLTSADLHRNDSKKELTTRNAEIITCEDFNGYMVSAANTQACINYLNTISTTSCGVPADSSDIIFCQTADAYIWGTNLWGAGQAESSSCYDVAMTAQNVVNQCVLDGMVEGYAHSSGNSNLLISIEPYSYCE